MASAELSTLLSSLGLAQHINAIADLGAENVEDLEDATDAELISLGMQPDGVAKLRAAIANPTEAPTVVIAQPLVAEVPVLQPVVVQPVSPYHLHTECGEARSWRRWARRGADAN